MDFCEVSPSLPGAAAVFNLPVLLGAEVTGVPKDNIVFVSAVSGSRPQNTRGRLGGPAVPSPAMIQGPKAKELSANDLESLILWTTRSRPLSC